MANHVGVQANPQAAGRDMYAALVIGPKAPPPVDHPGAYSKTAEGEMAPSRRARGSGGRGRQKQRR